MVVAQRFSGALAQMYIAMNGRRNQASYRVNVPASAATAAPSSAPQPCVSRNRTVKYSSPQSAPRNTDSVIGVDPRYSVFGFSRNTATPAIAAVVLVNNRWIAANRNAAAIV